jgi:hypothetical protein
MRGLPNPASAGLRPYRNKTACSATSAVRSCGPSKGIRKAARFERRTLRYVVAGAARVNSSPLCRTHGTIRLIRATCGFRCQVFFGEVVSWLTHILGALAALTVPSVVGVACAFYPRFVQRLVTTRRLGPLLQPLMHIRSTRAFLESPRFAQSLRIQGFVILFAVGLFRYILVLGKHR